MAEILLVLQYSREGEEVEERYGFHFNGEALTSIPIALLNEKGQKAARKVVAGKGGHITAVTISTSEGWTNGDWRDSSQPI